MSIAQRVGYLADLFKPSITSDSEIREELEFHLAMREQDNLASGMDPVTAREDAQERFGDFEKNFSEYRKAAQGLRPLLFRIQFAAMLALAATVAYLCIALWQTRSSYEVELRSLRSQVAKVQSPGAASAEAKSSRLLSLAGLKRKNEAVAAGFATDPMSFAWCDWSALD